jgi:spore coat protein U-like protein
MKKYVLFGVLLVAMLAAPAMAYTAGDGRTVVAQGAIAGTTTLTISNDQPIDFGAMVAGSTYNDLTRSVTLTTSYTDWYLSIWAENSGKMCIGTSPCLTNNLQQIDWMNLPTQPYYPLGASPGFKLKQSTGTSGTFVQPLYFQQVVANTDAPGSYSTTVHIDAYVA